MLAAYDLGWWGGDALRAVGRATGKAAGLIIDGGEWVIDKARDGAEKACEGLQNEYVQAGADIATTNSNPYAQGAGWGVKVGNLLCTIAATPESPPTTSSEAKGGAQVTMISPLRLAKRYPTGTIQAYFPKLNVWKIAAPAKKPKGLGQLAPALREDVIKDKAFRTSQEYVRAMTSDRPYLDAYIPGLGQWEISTSDKAASGVPTVSTHEFNKRTQPFYKRPWFWLAIGGGVAAIGTGAYVIARRRK